MQNKTCPECGAAIDGETELCPECGFKLSNRKEVETAGEQQKENLLADVPYRFDFNKGWKNVFDWFLSFGLWIGIALFIAGVIVYIVAGTKPENDALEILAKAADIKDARDTVNILVIIGLVFVLVQMIGEAAKDVYLKIYFGKWLSKRKELAVETILKYDVATASAKENSFIEEFAYATYHAHNPKENKTTAVTFVIYVAVSLFAMISTIFFAIDCIDLVAVKMLKDLIGEEFDIFKNLPLISTIICGVAWAAYVLVKKLCSKSYYKRYAKWAKEKGIL